MHLDPYQLSRAKKLFVLGDSTDMLFTALEGLGAELSTRWRVADRVGTLSQPQRQYVERIQTLSGTITYASNRFTDILFRQQEIDWKKEALDYVPKSNVFDQASDPKASSWRIFMGLAITASFSKFMINKCALALNFQQCYIEKKNMSLILISIPHSSWLN